MTITLLSMPAFDPLIQYITYTHHCRFQSSPLSSPHRQAVRKADSKEFCLLAAAFNCCANMLQPAAGQGGHAHALYPHSPLNLHLRYLLALIRSWKTVFPKKEDLPIAGQKVKFMNVSVSLYHQAVLLKQIPQKL